MTTSSNLALPYLAPAQAQKHVSVNESLRKLDALVQLRVVSATVTAQPASPADGDVYILPAGKTGAAWGPMANGALAYWRDGAWEAITPREGWLAWARDTDTVLVFDGAAWAGIVALLTKANAWSAQQSFTANAPTRFERAGSLAQFLLELRRDGSVRGWLGASDTDALIVNNVGGAGVFTVSGIGGPATLGSDLRPQSDNQRALGAASFRFSQLFAGSGTINTSDAREKTPLAPVGEALQRAAARIRAGIGVFQWLEAVERKGADGARLHVGVTAQAVRDAFLAEGLDPGRYGLFCEDPLFERVETAPARVETDSETGEAIAIPARFEERPVLSATGAPVTRLGVRADQLAFLLLAAG